MDLWALDEVRFEHGSACRMWVPPEVKDPFCCIIRPGRALATLEPSASGTGSSYSREDKRFNADTFFAFLKSSGGSPAGPGAGSW